MIERIQSGDQDAKQQFVVQGTSRIRRYLIRELGDVDDADDCLQLTFLRALRSITTFRGQSTLSTWLFSIAHHVLLEHRRASQRRARGTAALAAQMRVRSSVSYQPTCDPFVAKLLEGALAQLSWRERVTLMMFAAGFTHDQIGRELNVATGSSKALLHRARRRLRPMLEHSLDRSERGRLW